jgi:outer membrane protein assembly factor BamA
VPLRLSAARSYSFLAVVLAAVLLSGCLPRTARRRVETDLVADISVEGLDGSPTAESRTLLQKLPAVKRFLRPVTEEQVRSQLGQSQGGILSRLPVLNRFARAPAFDPDLLSEDARRIETWLAHQGFFEGRVGGWRVDRERPRRYRKDGTLRKGGVVDLTVQTDLGPRSTVRDVKVVWTDELSSPFWRSNQTRTLRRTGYVQPGEPFELGLAESTREELLERIRDHGHAWGEVELIIDAYPAEEVVDVTFKATTGPPTVIERVEVKGNEDVRATDIRTTVRLEPGAPTRVTDFRQAEQRLVGLGVFSVATVQPQLGDGPPPDAGDEPVGVPVLVEVTEGSFGTFRAGGGVVYDGTSVAPRVSGEVRHSNLDGRLMRFDASANLGLGIPIVGGISESRILGGFDVGVTRRRVFGAGWDGNAQVAYQRDLISGQLLQQRARITGGLTHRFTESVVLTLDLSPELVRLGSGNPFDFSTAGDLSSDDKLLAAATFGLTGTDLDEGIRTSFLLTTVEARLTIDWRRGADGQEASLDPRSGYYYVAAIRQAVPLGGQVLGDYRFTDLYGEARFYTSPLIGRGGQSPLTLALRAKGRWLPTPGGQGFQREVPFPERAFLGGTNDMRGFRLNNVGPYDCICLTEESTTGVGGLFSGNRDVPTRIEANPTYLPRGGRFSALLSAQATVRDRAGRGVALFTDAGVLGTTLQDLIRIDRTLRWDVGIGYRQATPVGPFRIDLAFRPAYPEDLGPMRPSDRPADPDIDNPAYFRGRTYGCEPIPNGRLPRRVPGLFISNDLGRELPPVIVNLSIGIGEAL